MAPWRFLTGKDIVLLPANEVVGKVMFSLVSFCLFTGGPHVTISYDVLDLTVPSPGHQQWTPCPLPPPLHVKLPPETSTLGPRSQHVRLLRTSGYN